ncbi:hypothetical protein BGZ57DRAFT_854411 [Hyaloscypha finlandica]|nr:hypothetical protein BGZ57DRAFT_854411 [Hyaloscypha finlandica]
MRRCSAVWDCCLRCAVAPRLSRLSAASIGAPPSPAPPRAQVQLPYDFHRLRLFDIAVNSLDCILGIPPPREAGSGLCCGRGVPTALRSEWAVVSRRDAARGDCSVELGNSRRGQFFRDSGEALLEVLTGLPAIRASQSGVQASSQQDPVMTTLEGTGVSQPGADFVELGYLLLGLRVYVLNLLNDLVGKHGACARVEEIAERVNTNDACQAETLWTE